MDLAAKTTVPRAPSAARLVPSIVPPPQLSGRRDNPTSRLRLTVAAEAAAHAIVCASDTGFAEEERVAEAAAWIRTKVATTLRKGAEDIGEYVLCKFFGGDPNLARLRSPKKNASYRALAARCGTPELPISKTWLNNAVAIALIVRALPATASVFRTLPPSYQETLLPIRDPAAVETLARDAVEGAVTCRELRRIVATKLSRPNRHRRHRGAQSLTVKAKIQQLAACAMRLKACLSRSEIDTMAPADRNQSLRLLDAVIETLGRIRSAANRNPPPTP